MPNQNIVLLAGHLGKDPEVRFMPNGGKVANFSVAWNQPPKKGSTETKGQVHWLDVKCYGHVADVAGELRKGDGACITARAWQEKWVDKQTQKDKSRIVFMADSIAPWVKESKAEAATEAKAATTQEAPAPTAAADDPDDVPF